MHKKPYTVSDADGELQTVPGHFRLAVLHVGSKEVVLRYDSLLSRGVSQLIKSPIAQYDLHAVKTGWYVAEMRCVLCVLCTSA